MISVYGRHIVSVVSVGSAGAATKKKEKREHAGAGESDIVDIGLWVSNGQCCQCGVSGAAKKKREEGEKTRSKLIVAETAGDLLATDPLFEIAFHESVSPAV